MPIKIRCRCGQGFQAPDKLAGKKVRCPKCGNPLLIPAPEREPEASPDAGGRDMSALLDEIGVETTPDGGKRCPQCNVTLAGTAVFCVGCGFHLETQEYVYSPDEQVTKDGLPQRKSFGNPLLDKAAKEMDYDKQQALVSTDPRSWYSYIVGLTLVLVFMTVGAIISMNLTAKETDDRILADPKVVTFWGLMLISVMLMAGPWVQITYRAFRDNLLHGFGCLLTFCYCPVYAIMRWSKLKRPFYMLVFGIILLIGTCTIYLFFYLTTAAPSPLDLYPSG